MSTYETYTRKGFYRSSDRAVLGGVCAGFADYFGMNLKVLRVLAVIAFFCAMPMAVIAYLAVVFLVPARDSGYYQRPVQERKMSRRERRKARKQAQLDAEYRARAAPSEAAAAVRSKCQVLDERLARLEEYITSSRYRLDQEFRSL